jgi:hypothetical protein
MLNELKAKIKIFKAIGRNVNNEQKQELNCLAYFKIGEKILSGKTDKDGVIGLRNIVSGTYWIAIKSKNEEAVYAVNIPEHSRQINKIIDLPIHDLGLVINKCEAEPIRLFIN